MADGAIQGVVRGRPATFEHTDGNAQVVATLDMTGKPEGIYNVTGYLSTFKPSGGGGTICSVVNGTAVIDEGACAFTVGAANWENLNGTGYAVTADNSGMTLRLKCAAANGVRSVGRLEAFGVEAAIALA